ncbi:MAG: antibiotic biosynthesis monooxygenase [bacterium]
MIVVNRFAVDDPAFADELATALEVLAARPGYLRGSAGRSTDDTADWVLVTEWAGVGDYRRALGNYQVKLQATPVLGRALDQPAAFEQLVFVAPDGTVTRDASDRARDPWRRAEAAAQRAVDGSTDRS